jgi:Tol biopolymer transport system component
MNKLLVSVVAASSLLFISGCSSAGGGSASGHLAWGEETSTGVVVYTSNADGSNKKQLKLPGGDNEGPAWSPDGKKLVVATSTNEGRVVGATVNPDGSGFHAFPAPADGPNLACVVWSPDTKHFACEGFDDNHPELNGIYVVDAKGENPKRLTQVHDAPCAYSPDGKQILFIRLNAHEEQSALMTINADGSKEHLVTTMTVGLACDWSPDGKTFLAEQDGTLFLIDLNGKAKGINDGLAGLYDTRGAFSPDGNHIIFSRQNVTGKDEENIWTMDIDGSHLKQITHKKGVGEEFGAWGL